MVTAAQAYWLNRKRRQKRAASEGVGVPAWVLSGAALDLDFAEALGYNSLDRSKFTPDDILTYTSPSPKLIYGDAGVLGYAPHNLLTRSQEFDNAAWVKTDTTVSADATVAPNGAATADLLTEGSAGTGQVGQTVSILSGIAFTVSLSLKRGNTNWLRIQVVNVGDFFRLWVNLNTGAIGTAAGGGSGVYISSSITAEAGGWYRVSITGTLPATSATLFVNTSSADNSSTRVSGGTYYPWGAQISRGSAALTYIPTTTAAVYSLPIDHNPTTFDPLGVLIEEQRTNLLTYSQQFDNAAWTPIKTTVSANAASAPNGVTSADKLAENAATGVHEIYNASGITLTAAAYTASIFLKSAERTKVRLTLATAASALGARVIVDLSAGTLAAVENLGAHTGGAATIQALPDGWYRVSLTITGTAASYFVALALVTGTSTTSYEGTTGSGVLVWGAQLEAGSSPTSLVPTVASQVTRAADQVSILTSAFGYSAAAGTMVIDVQSAPTTAAARPFTFDNGSSNNQILVEFLSGTAVGAVLDALAVQASISIATAAGANKVALAFAANDFAESVNGGAVSTDVSGTMPTGMTTVQIGRRAFSAGLYFNSHIKRLTYFPTRKSDAELQALTA